MAQTKADNLRLVESVAMFARTVARRTNTITAIRTQDPHDEDDGTARPIDLSTDTLTAANEISDVLYRVSDLSAAEPAVLIIAAGKLLAKFATIYGEDAKPNEPEDRGTENAVMLASAGFVLGLEAFIREVQEGSSDDVDFSDTDDEGDEDLDDDENVDDDETADELEDEAEDDDDDDDSYEDDEDKVQAHVDGIKTETRAEEADDEEPSAGASAKDVDADVPPKEEARDDDLDTSGKERRARPSLAIKHPSVE